MDYPIGSPKPSAVPGLTIPATDANAKIAYEVSEASNKVVQVRPEQSLYSN